MSTTVDRRFLMCPRPTAFLACAGLALALVGCDSRTPTAKAVEEASRQMALLNTSGGPTQSQELEKEKYSAVKERLSGVLDQGYPEEQAAALVLTAQATLGLAEHSAAEFASLERETLNRSTVIRGHLNAWLSHNSLATSTEGFDPSAVIADFQKQSAEKAGVIEAATKRKGELDAKIASLREQAKAALDAAAAEENSYAQLKAQAASLSATQAEPIVHQAAARKRNADKFRQQSAELTGQAGQLDPQAREAQLEVDQFTNQRKSLDELAAQLRQRSEDAKKEAAGARADAAKVADQLSKALDQLREERGGPLAQAYDQAARLFADAAATARKASGDNKGASALTLGTASQAAGDLHWARARGQRGYLELLRSLAATNPGLPFREKLLGEAADTEKAIAESIENAKQAYEQARAAFSSAKATGEVKEKLQNLSTLLEKLPDVIDGKLPDMSAAMAAVKKSEEPAAEEPAAPAAEENPASDSGDLNVAVDAALKAVEAGRVADLIRGAYFPPELQNLAEGLALAGESQTRLMGAIKAKFGDEALVGLQQAGSMAGSGASELAQLKGKTAADLEIKSEGDSATVAAPGQPPAMFFKRVDNTWKLDLRMDQSPMPIPKDQLQSFLPEIAKAMDELAAEVDAGKYKTAQAVQVGLMQKIQPLMLKLQEGGGGGG